MKIEEKRVVLIPEKPVENTAIPLDNCSSHNMIYVFSIKYFNNSTDCLVTQSDIATYNRKHPLAKIFDDCKYISQKTDLQKFVSIFVPGIAREVKEGGKELFKSSRWLKHVGHMYFTVDWSQYAPNLSPPYKVWHQEKGNIEITEDTFNTWRNCDFKEEL